MRLRFWLFYRLLSTPQIVLQQAWQLGIVTTDQVGTGTPQGQMR